jgi:hypothetical protein
MDGSPPRVLGTARTDDPRGHVCAADVARTGKSAHSPAPVPAESAMVDSVSEQQAERGAMP